MTDLRDLYQEVIIDHNRNPRNRRKMTDADRRVEGFNPLCGDQLVVYVKIDDDGVIDDISFEGRGCAISTASASIMTEVLRGKTEQEAEAMFHGFHGFVTGEDQADSASALGKLQVLGGVRNYPARVKCATLAWHTVHAALKNEADRVTTE